MYCESKNTRDIINHICLVNNRPVISAGKIIVLDEKVLNINNASGHYQPSGESLDYIECLLKKWDSL